MNNIVNYFKCTFLLVLLLFSTPSFAESCMVEKEAPTVDLVCPALWKAKAYKNNKSYKMLESGDDGWIFRTNADFKNDFELSSVGLKNFSRLQKALKSQNIELVIALLPTRGMMHNTVVADCAYDYTVAIDSYNKLADQLHGVGISIATVPIQNYPDDFYYKRDSE